MFSRAVGEVPDAVAAAKGGADSCAKGGVVEVRTLEPQQVEEFVNRGKDWTARDYLLTPTNGIFQFSKVIDGVPGSGGAAGKTTEVLVELYVYASGGGDTSGCHAIPVTVRNDYLIRASGRGLPGSFEELELSGLGVMPAVYLTGRF